MRDLLEKYLMEYVHVKAGTLTTGQLIRIVFHAKTNVENVLLLNPLVLPVVLLY